MVGRMPQVRARARLGGVDAGLAAGPCARTLTARLGTCVDASLAAAGAGRHCLLLGWAGSAPAMHSESVAGVGRLLPDSRQARTSDGPGRSTALSMGVIA